MPSEHRAGAPPAHAPRLLLVTRKWPPALGGMERYSKEIAEALAGLVPLTVLALPGRPDGRPPSRLALAGFLVRAMLQLAWAGRRQDAILFGDFALFPLALWASWVAPRTRRAVAVHGLDLVFGRRSGLVPGVYRQLLAIARSFPNCVHCLVANSAATGQLARELGFRGVAVVPLGIALAPRPGEPATTAHLNSCERYILFVGRLVPRKGAAWFALQVLPRLPSDIGFKVVGAPWDASETARVAAAPRTTYLGPVSDDSLRDLRRRAMLTVMPNRRMGAGDIEGFGLAALEAVAEGSLLVASGIEGILDAVEDGKTGFLLPEGDANAWVGKINELSAWPPEAKDVFIEGAQRRLEEKYSWDRVARETLRAITSSDGS